MAVPATPAVSGPESVARSLSARGRAALVSGAVVLTLALVAAGLVWLHAEVSRAPLLCSPGGAATAVGTPRADGSSAGPTVCLNR